jgi:hypothetical protein
MQRSNGPIHEALVIGGIVTCSLVALAFGIAAVATPDWHYTLNGFAHVRRGLWETCSVERVDGALRYYCQVHSSRPVCGHDIVTIRNRFIWPAVLAMLSLVTTALLPIGATLSWCLYRPRPRTLLILSLVSLALMVTAMTIYVHTLDAWYFCGREFCSFARAELLNSEAGFCFSGLGYSFILVLLYDLGLVMVAVACALYARWVRLGLIVDADAIRKMEEKKKQRSTDGKALPDGDALDASVENAKFVGSLSLDDPHADWVFDQATGMYWSAVNGLYLEPASNRFYDPASDCWHDPETDQWIPAHRW